MRLNGILPPEATSGASRAVLSGRKSLLVEQHNGILSYDDACVRLRTAAGLMTISGAELCVDAYTSADIRVTGRIDAVSFL